MRSRPVVAIDGPAGAGKSTVSRQVAQELDYLLLDTGAIYRLVALAAIRSGIDSHDETQLAELAAGLADTRGLGLHGPPGDTRALLRGEDVSQAIRTQSVAAVASQVSTLAKVRAALLPLQRSFGEPGGVVAEGRDMGTVVFPDAEAKFFLTASPDVRAQRRHRELLGRGESADLEQVQREVAERDERDSQRLVAPLRCAADAALIDASSLEVREVVGRIVERVRMVEQQLRG